MLRVRSKVASLRPATTARKRTNSSPNRIHVWCDSSSNDRKRADSVHLWRLSTGIFISFCLRLSGQTVACYRGSADPRPSPEHIQAYCAVRQLQQEFGFCLWFSNYVSKRAKWLRTRLASSIHIGRRAALATDLRLARRIQQLYVNNLCWTWYFSYRCRKPRNYLVRSPAQLEAH